MATLISETKNVSWNVDKDLQSIKVVIDSQKLLGKVRGKSNISAFTQNFTPLPSRLFSEAAS
jgi:hypothetical protein